MYNFNVFANLMTYASVKPGFHYPSWRPELTARVDGWPVSFPVNTGRVDGRAFPLTELTGRFIKFINEWMNEKNEWINMDIITQISLGSVI